MDTRVKRLVPIPEARQVLGGIGHTTVYELINRGEIIKVNIGRRGFITSESLEAYMDRLSAVSCGGDAVRGQQHLTPSTACVTTTASGMASPSAPTTSDSSNRERTENRKGKADAAYRS